MGSKSCKRICLLLSLLFHVFTHTTDNNTQQKQQSVDVIFRVCVYVSQTHLCEFVCYVLKCHDAILFLYFHQ